jgi:pimeloyl-ACP methyl ester carboxylesterase
MPLFSDRRNPLLIASELPRAAGEFGAAVALGPLLGRMPRGDGHHVVVFPGLAASDTSTRYLRRYLRNLGYFVHGWRLGRNVGPNDFVVDGLRQRMELLRETHGEPMSLIGWSLGGIYARQIARVAPEDTRMVITLGSPFRMARQADAPPVPITNVFTRGDGIVPWQSCLDEPGPQRENVEVRGSHCGLGHNPAALVVIADRLAQPAGTWKPFVAPRGTRRLFPTR